MDVRAPSQIRDGSDAHFFEGQGGLAVVTGLVGVALIWRLALADYSLWFDEYASVFFASQPLDRLWGPWMLRETNPPLFYTILRGWIDAFGIDRAGLRIPGIASSITAMVVIFSVMSRFYGRRSAVAAILILALSPQQLYYSHQVRAYIFLYLAIAISFAGLIFIVKAKSKRDELIGWPLYVFGAVIGIYLHTTAVVWPLAATAAMLTVHPRLSLLRPMSTREAWFSIIVANVLVLLCSSWWIYMTALQVRNPNGNLNWMKGLGLTKSVAIYIATLFQSRQVTLLQLPAPMMFGLFLIVGVWKGRRDSGTHLALACLCYASMLFVALSFKQPVFLARTILWLSLFSLVIAANGVASLQGRRFVGALALIALFSAINLALIKDRLLTEEWRGMIRRAASDRAATVFVDGEAMGVVTQLACRVELGSSKCPFPVVTMIAPGLSLDSWADGYAHPSSVTKDERLYLPAGANAYMIRRNFHDALADAYRARAFLQVPGRVPPKPILAGPYDSSFTNLLVNHTVVRKGLVIIPN